MFWQLFIIISAITLSVSVLLRRILLHKDKTDPVTYAIVFQVLTGILIFIYSLINGFKLPDFGQYWWVILITTGLFAAGHTVSAKAFQLVEASAFSVLYATSAIWTMIVGVILFGDQITLQQLLGIVLMFVSIGVLAERKNILKLDRGIILGLITGALFGLATVGWVYVGNYSDIPTWSAFSFVISGLLVLLVRPKAVLKMKSILKVGTLSRMTILAAVFATSAITALYAFTNGNMGIVAVVQQSSIIITTILGIIFLKEKDHFLRKIISAILCFIAVILII